MGLVMFIHTSKNALLLRSNCTARNMDFHHHNLNNTHTTQQLVMSNKQFTVAPNPALNLAPYGRWTLRDKAAPRRLASRYAL